MTTMISVPVTFRLAAGWEPADPAASGAPNAAFVAVHPASRSEGVTANLTLSELERPAGTPLDDVADEALGRLVRFGREVTLVRRETYGTAAAPAIAQLVTLIVPLGDVPRRMTQYQVFLALGDVVFEVVLTAAPEQFQTASAGFGEFVGSIRLDVG
jgi:hypothetical protein